MSTEPIATAYPASLEIEYPVETNRLTTLFRIFTVIPIAIIAALLSRDLFVGAHVTVSASGILFAPVLLMLLFRKKYPRWWFDWNLALSRFSMRVTAYLLLLQHAYPSTDEEQGVHLDLSYPDAEQELSRGLPLVKWFLVIPHIFILLFLAIASFFVTIIAWFAILFTGKYPAGMFNFIVGVLRWRLRVEAYAVLLITDRYPPFSLEP